MLRKDAKIAIIVIMLLMVVVVIIWGRSPRPQTDAETYTDQGNVTLTDATTDPPAPVAPHHDPLADLRRQAPTRPPTDLDPSPAPLPAMMNNLPPRAELIHTGTPEPDRRAADRHDPLPARDDGHIPTGPLPKPKPEPKPAFLAIHTIVKGDSYTKLARDYYNDERKWRTIYEANKIPPQALTIGRVIKIPHLPKPPEPRVVRGKGTPPPPSDAADVARKLAGKAPDRTIGPAPAAATLKTYTVRKGDSFYSIARRIYRDPTLWKKLYEHNRARLPKPAEPNSLRAGTVIELPNLAG